MAVDHERVVVEQQRVVGRGRRLERPRGPVEERVVLRVDAEGGVAGDPHRVGGASPDLDLGGHQADPRGELAVRLRGLGGELAAQARREPEVRLRHQVRVAVVVDERGVLVRPGDLVDAERAVAGRDVVAEVRPQPRGLEHDLGATVGEQGPVARRGHVLGDRIRDVRVDVVLRGAGREVGGRLLAADRAPRVQGPGLAHLGRAGPSLVEDPAPVAQQRPGDRRLRVGEERQGEDLGVPEVVALVALAREALGREARPAVAPRRLEQAEQVEPDALLEGTVPVELHVGRAPEPVEDRALLVDERVEAAVAHLVDLGPCLLDERLLGVVERGAVGEQLGHRERPAVGDVGRDHDHDAVLVVGRRDRGPRGAAVDAHEVVGRGDDRQARHARALHHRPPARQ